MRALLRRRAAELGALTLKLDAARQWVGGIEILTTDPSPGGRTFRDRATQREAGQTSR